MKTEKTIQYILITVIILFVIMLATMLGMRYFGGEQMREEMERSAPADTTSTQRSDVSVTDYTDISTKELARMLENKDFTLVNVHIPYIGDIAGTDLSIPFNKIADNLDKLPSDKNAKIVLYCQSGSMSAIAADTLVRLGYRNVYNVEGGMIQWQRDGNKLVFSNGEAEAAQPRQ